MHVNEYNNVIYLYLHPFVRNVPKHLQYEAYEGTFVPSRVTRKQAGTYARRLCKNLRNDLTSDGSIINDEQSDGKIDTDTGFFFAAGAAVARKATSFPYFAHDPFVYAGSSLYYSKQRDICGVCDGDTSSCQGSTTKLSFSFDACGDCINLGLVPTT